MFDLPDLRQSNGCATTSIRQLEETYANYNDPSHLLSIVNSRLIIAAHLGRYIRSGVRAVRSLGYFEDFFGRVFR